MQTGRFLRKGFIMEHTEAKEMSASEYRTRWLMAHNRLHELVHAGGQGDAKKVWVDYLGDLETVPEVISKPA